MPVNMNMRILIVDDFKTMLKIIESLLKQLGFKHIDEATDGTMALEKLKANKYDLILSDWNMEPMTGIDLLKHVRANPTLKHIPVVLITAESKAENIIAAKQAGVNNYIVKPFNAITLKEKLTAVIGQF
ncbi:MAG: response regulator [Alphaproteobacteria bacterium]|nr:response regulator [Alphaproteobacteria bacterium]